ncbi:MAG: WG repeat-containing protein, partial [Promethearchaeota archaeon]
MEKKKHFRMNSVKNFQVDYKMVKISLDETHHVLHGKPIYQKRFKKVMSFHPPGVAAVLDTDGRAYHINVSGEPFHDRKFSQAFGYYDDIAAVQDESGWYHVDLQGNPIYDSRFTWVGNFQDGFCPVRDEDGYYFHVNKIGHPAYHQKYLYAGDFRYGIASVMDIDGRFIHVNEKGERIHESKFDFLGVYHKGYALAKEREGFLHVDKAGNPIYRQHFEYLEPFYNGRALARTLDGRWIIINEDGNEIHVISRPRLRSNSSDVLVNAELIDKALLKEVMDDLVAFWKPQAIYSAVKLGIFSFLFEHGKTKLKHLFSALQIDEKRGKRLTDVLVVHDYLQMNEDHVSLTRKGK